MIKPLNVVKAIAFLVVVSAIEKTTSSSNLVNKSRSPSISPFDNIFFILSSPGRTITINRRLFDLLPEVCCLQQQVKPLLAVATILARHKNCPALAAGPWLQFFSNCVRLESDKRLQTLSPIYIVRLHSYQITVIRT